MTEYQIYEDKAKLFNVSVPKSITILLFYLCKIFNFYQSFNKFFV